MLSIIRNTTVLVAGISAFSMVAQSSAPPVETAVYRTGAWFAPRTPEQRRLYLAGGFTMLPYTRENVRWAAEHDLVFIGSVSIWGMPPGLGDLFESADGVRSASVGLFTRVNFNSPDVEAWWEKRVPELVRAMPGADRVAFWKVHNEFGYHSGKIYDYSPGSLRRYRRWLRQRYGTIENLNRWWGTSWESFEAVQPPRTREQMRADLANWLEWRRFTCWNFADYFRHTGDLIRKVVPGARVSDNFYTTSPLQGWDNFELARQTDYLAYDIYAIGRWPRLITNLDHARTAAAAWNKPFIIMEYHAGPNHWAREVRREDLLIEASLAFARECRALQWFRWIPGGSGREQGIHGMMDSRGRPTERFTAAAEVSALAQRLAPILARSRTEAEVAVVTSSDNAYLAYASGQDVWRDRRRWDVLCLMLDAARIQADQIDPPWIEANPERLGRYDAVILAHLPVLSDAAVRALSNYAAAGGCLVVHPDVALRNKYGKLRTDPSLFQVFDGSTARSPDENWTVRRILGDGTLYSVKKNGKGRIVYCGYELPDQQGDRETFLARARDYAEFLQQYAGVTPAVEIDASVSPDELDVRRLKAGPVTLIVLTSLAGRPVKNVAVSVPGIPENMPAVFLTPQSAAATRLQATFRNGALRFTVPEVTPSALVLIARQWQPVLSLEAPKRVFPGQEFEAAVRLINCGAESATARVELKVPSGWRCIPIGGKSGSDDKRVLTVAPGAESEAVRFRIAVPRDAAVDRFGVENPIVASATFTSGRSGALSVRHLPFVMPALDVLVYYRGSLVTPWQELTPPVMRWGWNNEVHTPPPPPVACNAKTPVTLRIAAAPRYAGQRVRLGIRGPEGSTSSVSPQDVSMPADSGPNGVQCDIPATVFLPAPGEYVLTARCDGGPEGAVRFEAGVNVETVEAVLADSALPALPAGWRPLARLGVGVRDADALGRAAGFDLPAPLPAQGPLAVFDAAGRRCASVFSPDRVLVAVDASRNTTQAFVLASGPAGAPKNGGPADMGSPARVRVRREDGDAVVIAGDAYAVCFDVALGLVRWMKVGDHKAIRWRTGVVATLENAGTWAPDGKAGASGFGYAVSPVHAEVSFSRPIGPEKDGLTVEEKWSLDPGRIGVTVRVANRTNGPITLAGLDYDLGVDPDELPRWELRAPREKDVRRGRLPAGFVVNKGQVADWLAADGRTGIGLTLRRCALMTKWQSGFTGVRHTLAGTAIGLMRRVHLDPGDVVLAEFDLWPHRGPLGAVGDPVFVTVIRSESNGR